MNLLKMEDTKMDMRAPEYFKRMLGCSSLSLQKVGQWNIILVKTSMQTYRNYYVLR